MGVSRTIWRTGAAPISLAVGRQETRTTHSVQHNGETCECHLPVPLYPTLLLKQQIIRRFSLCRPSSNRPTVYCPILYYTVLSCPALSSVPPHTHTHMHTYVVGTAWFLAARVLDTPLRARQVATVSVAQMSGLLQLHLNRGCTALHCTARHWLHCTGTTGLDWTGWRRWAWLPSERASKAVELLRCAPGLPVPLSPLHSLSTVHFQISTHWVPPSIPTRLSTPPPRTKLRHLLSSSLSSLHLETHLWAT